MKYNIGDKVWLKEDKDLDMNEGVYKIEQIDYNHIHVCNSYTNRRYVIHESVLMNLLHHLPCEVEKKDNIERLERIIDKTRIRQPNTEEIINKINEIIDYINKED